MCESTSVDDSIEILLIYPFDFLQLNFFDFVANPLVTLLQLNCFNVNINSVISEKGENLKCFLFAHSESQNNKKK